MNRKTVLLITHQWPEPESTAAGRRTLDLLTLLADANFSLHIACTAHQTPYSSNLRARHWTIHTIAINSTESDTIFIDIQPDIILFDRFHTEEKFHWRIKKLLPNALTILDTSDLHFLRTARERSIKQKEPLTLYNDIALREIAAILRCDLTLIISTFEQTLLLEKFSVNSNLLFYLPFLVSPSTKTDEYPPLDQRRHCIALGNFLHAPNVDAVQWLKSVIWPKLRAKLPPKTELHIAGAYATPAINQLHNPKEFFIIKGRINDSLNTLGNYRLNLAPLRFGAGIKGKILEGWISQTPTISTTVGLEGMATHTQVGYPLSNQATDFINLSAKAYCNHTFAQTLVDNGRNILQKNFNKANFEASFLETISHLCKHLTQHRNDNFYGQLLWQNQFKTTEYMSKWIELKNAFNAIKST